MTLSDDERKAQQREYRSRPEVKARQKDYQKEYNARPERKAKLREDHLKPEFIAKRKEYRSTPEAKAKATAYNLTPEVKAKHKEYNARPEVKAKHKEYYARPEVQAREKALRATPEAKTKQKEYDGSPKRLVKRKNDRDNLRLSILQTYSKRLSNSDIPCCRCCGDSSHIEFLAIDHIAGRKKMEPELVKLGYSPKWKTSNSLLLWMVKNDFPKGFQILCHNCNFAKGHSKDNKCPHEK